MRSETFKDSAVPAKQQRFAAKRKIYPERTDIVADLVCYCFEYSVDDIHRDYLENGRSTIMKKIQVEKKFGNCRMARNKPI